MNKEILVLGKGFIGIRISQELNCNITAEHIYSFSDAEKLYSKFNSKIIINCIGTTGKNNVDDCEKDIEKTLIANTFVPIILGELAVRRNIKLVHISSGCIYYFDYEKQDFIKEEDIPDYFELFYSRTKIYSERALETLSKKFNILILRIRIPLDIYPHPKNILTKLIRYKKVINIPNSITYLPDFISALKHLLKKDSRGIFNVVNKGGLRYPELLNIYKKYVPDYKYNIIDFKDLNLTRTNLILSTAKLEKTGFRVRDIHEVLEECVQGYIKY